MATIIVMLIIILALIFCRPFIASLAFPAADSILTGLLLFSLALWTFQRRATLCERLRGFRLPLAMMLSALLLSAFFSVSPHKSFATLPGSLAGLLLFCFAGSLDDKEKKRLFLIGMAAAVVISCGAIYQFIWGFGRISDYLRSQPEHSSAFALDYIRNRRAFFPFITPNALAGYLIMTLPLFRFLPRAKTGLYLTLPALILTQSVGALISLTTAFLSDRKRRTAVLLTLGGIALAVMLIRMRAAQPVFFSPGFSMSARFGYWKDTLQAISAHPLLGSGPGTFTLASSRYAHNSYLQLAAETGFIGLSAFLLFLFALGKELVKSSRRPSNDPLLTTAIAAFLLHNLVDFTILLPEVSFLFWILSGCALSQRRPLDSTKSSASQ